MSRPAVYFVETTDGRFIKIGFSTNVKTRMSQLGTLRPSSFSFRLIGSFPASQETERWLHQQFAEDRDRGEWFRSSDRLRQLITCLRLDSPTDAERAVLGSGPPVEVQRSEWYAAIAKYVESRDAIQMCELLSDALGVPESDRTMKARQYIGKILSGLGFRHTCLGPRENRVAIYRRTYRGPWGRLVFSGNDMATLASALAAPPPPHV